jgi:hypothetical protein
VGDVEVTGRSGSVLNRGDPKGDDACPLGRDPMASATASTPDPSVGEECLQVDLDTTVGADAKSLDPKVAKILSEAVAATPEVHQLREILPTALRVSGYSEKPVTKKDQVMFNN